MIVTKLERAVEIVDLGIDSQCPIAVDTLPDLTEVLVDPEIASAIGPIVMANCPHPNDCVWNGCNGDCEK